MHVPDLTQRMCSQVHLLSAGPAGTRIFFRFFGGHTVIGVRHNETHWTFQPPKSSSSQVHNLVHSSFVYCSPTLNKRPLASGQPNNTKKEIFKSVNELNLPHAQCKVKP